MMVKMFIYPEDYDKWVNNHTCNLNIGSVVVFKGMLVVTYSLKN